MPPSAMTVCALPRSDLQISPNGNAGGGRFDGGAQSGAARADHENVVLKSFIFRHA